MVPARASAPEIKYPEIDDRLPIIQENSIVQPRITIWGIERKIWEAEQKYNLPHGMLYNLAMCESSLHHDDVWGDHETSYGLFQFKLKTWRYYCQKYEIELNILNVDDQIELASRILADGDYHNWKNCLR